VALSLAQKSSLMTSDLFLGRVKAAILTRASFVLGQGLTPSGAEQMWAQRMSSGAAAAAAATSMMPRLVNHSLITASTAGDGSDVTDANLQTAVESMCEFYG
jgi:hypothetical protein